MEVNDVCAYVRLAGPVPGTGPFSLFPTGLNPTPGCVLGYSRRLTSSYTHGPGTSKVTSSRVLRGGVTLHPTGRGGGGVSTGGLPSPKVEP